MIVCYFTTTAGVKNKVLEFSNLPEETADLIHTHIMKVVNNFDLKNKISVFRPIIQIRISEEFKERIKIIYLLS